MMPPTDFHEQPTDWTRPALLAAAAWIVAALTASFALKVDWLAPGDFDYATAMHYHALMVPLLVMLFLLVVRTLDLSPLRGRAYGAAAIAAVALAGAAGLANRSEGLSAVAVVQIVGMTLTDLLGLVLIVCALRATYKCAVAPSAAFWLLVYSLAAVILAAPFGHLAGWGVDVGMESFPGAPALAKAASVSLDEFQEGLVGAHSHLIVAAMLSALAALAALKLGYASARGWRKTVSRVGAWLALAGIVSAAVMYAVSALAGWEPPAVFASDPNGMPLDDVILAGAAAGWLLLIVGLVAKAADGPRAMDALTRLAVFLNLAFGFAAAVGLGVYIEFHETFYGGGDPPAPGAANDQAYIRAHMLYAFMLLPALLAFLLAQPPRGRACAALALLGMALGLIGVFLWVGALNSSVFHYSMFAIDAALLAGFAGMWRGRRAEPPAPQAEGEPPA